MRHLVTSPLFLFKKALDNLLYFLSSRRNMRFESFNEQLSRVWFEGEPRGWVPLYTMVTFRPDISYATAKNKVARQSRVLLILGWTGTMVVGMAGILALKGLRMAVSYRSQA